MGVPGLQCRGQCQMQCEGCNTWDAVPGMWYPGHVPGMQCWGCTARDALPGCGTRGDTGVRCPGDTGTRCQAGTCRKGELDLLAHDLQRHEVVLLIEAPVVEQEPVPLLGGEPGAETRDKPGVTPCRAPQGCSLTPQLPGPPRYPVPSRTHQRPSPLVPTGFPHPIVLMPRGHPNTPVSLPCAHGALITPHLISPPPQMMPMGHPPPHTPPPHLRPTWHPSPYTSSDAKGTPVTPHCTTAGDAHGTPITPHPSNTHGSPRVSRQGEGEVEALAEAAEGEEGVWGEAAGAHGAEGLLVVPGGALAAEPPHQQVEAGAPVAADPRGAAAPPGAQLAALPCARPSWHLAPPKLGVGGWGENTPPPCPLPPISSRKALSPAPSLWQPPPVTMATKTKHPQSRASPPPPVGTPHSGVLGGWGPPGQGGGCPQCHQPPSDRGVVCPPTGHPWWGAHGWATMVGTGCLSTSGCPHGVPVSPTNLPQEPHWVEGQRTSCGEGGGTSGDGGRHGTG